MAGTEKRVLGKAGPWLLRLLSIQRRLLVRRAGLRASGSTEDHSPVSFSAAQVQTAARQASKHWTWQIVCVALPPPPCCCRLHGGRLTPILFHWCHGVHVGLLADAICASQTNNGRKDKIVFRRWVDAFFDCDCCVGQFDCSPPPPVLYLVPGTW